MKKSMTEIANSFPSSDNGGNGIDKGTTRNAQHGYTFLYDKLFSSLRDKDILLLEIGISGGGSLRLWQEYFSKAKIVAFDINDESNLYDELNLDKDRIFINKLDQSSKYQLQHLVQQFKENNLEFDIMIDDGSHHMFDQQITLSYLFPFLKSRGLYIIEDLHTSLLPNGFPVYGKSIEIQTDRKNTTLNTLTDSFSKPFDSVYLNIEQNKYLNENIDNIIISGRFNPQIDIWHDHSFYKGRSLTSVIIKK